MPQAVGEAGRARRISLGVFSDETRAATQSEKVARLGLLPQIEAREKPGTAIWLDLTLKSDSPPLEGQKFPAGDTELEFRVLRGRACRGARRAIAPRRVARLKSRPFDFLNFQGRLSSVGRAPDL